MVNINSIPYPFRKIMLWSQGRKINQACSLKDTQRLRRLLQRWDLLSMRARDWKNMRITQKTVLNCLRVDRRSNSAEFLDLDEPSSSTSETRGSALQSLGSKSSASSSNDGDEKASLSLSRPGVSCACLVLTVLFMRKLVDVMQVDSENIIPPHFWSGRSNERLEWALQLALREPFQFDCYQVWDNRNRPVEYAIESRAACVIMAAAVLQLDEVFQSHWEDPSFAFTSMFTFASIVKATLAGDEAALRSILSSQPQNYIAQHASAFFPYLQNLVERLGSVNLEGCMSVFRDVHAHCNMSVEDFLQSIVRLTCFYDRTSGDLRTRYPSTIDLVITHAPFFFDAKVVSDETLLSMDSYPWEALKDFMTLRKACFLDESAFKIIKKAQDNLIQRGKADMFLMALQDFDIVRKSKHTRYQRRVLELIGSLAGNRQLSLPVSPCVLCRNPTVSFLLWAIHHESRLKGDVAWSRIARKCMDRRLPSVAKVKQMRFDDLCDFHVNALPQPFSIEDVCKRWTDLAKFKSDEECQDSGIGFVKYTFYTTNFHS